MATLKLDWCDYKAAKYAVMHWHYSRIMPKSKNVYIGVWEDEKFIGALIFGLGGGGATNGKRWGLRKTFDVCELERVALREHETPVSRIIKIAMAMLRKQSPDIKAIVSFADMRQNHHGGIYQAGGWFYMGMTAPSIVYTDGKREYHERVVSVSGLKKHYGKYHPCMKKGDLKQLKLPPKHIYLMPLRDDVRKTVMALAKPYPKRATSETGDTSGNQSEKGGSTPTVALKNNS